MPARAAVKTLAASLLLLAVACASHAPPPGMPPVARYAGFLPCANCPALRMELAIFGDGRYEQRVTYVDTRDGDKVVTSAGRWKAAGGDVVELSSDPPGERRLVRRDGERSVRLLDDRRREIASPIPQVLLRAEREFVGDPVNVTEAQADQPIALQPGQELVVRLASNPTTGYRWSLRDAAQPVVAMLATPGYLAGESPPGMMGVGGSETWRFAAFRRGTQMLSFEYRRPWEGDTAPVRAVSFPVVVR